MARRKLTTEEFIIKAKKIHGDKYDYSKVIYTGANEKVKIICSEHGVFEQRASRHLQRSGCPKCCFDVMKSSTEEFIIKAKKIHGNKYDYSKTEYTRSQSKVKIICPEHGIFEQLANGHLNGKGCRSCSGKEKITAKEFILKAKKIHGDKYDYSKVIYTGSKAKVSIVCSEHGVFEQRPSDHLHGVGCPDCSFKRKRLTTEDFIIKAKKIHGDKYDYSKTEYTGSKAKVDIVCSEHGIFSQRAVSHLEGRGCPECSFKRKRLTIEDFIIKAREVHGNRYDYSEVEYVNNVMKIKIICTKHGVFEQRPSAHLEGQGCSSCSLESGRMTTEEFIIKARKIHGNKYDYSKVEYINNRTKVKIICSTHGVFVQSPGNHLFGYGCISCSGVKKLTTETFISKAREIHGNKYDYSEVKYINSKLKVKIICPVHGVFWQRPNDHLSDYGCPGCNSSKGEEAIQKFLMSEGILFEREKKFKELGLKRFDFYLPELNTIIEYDGEQHFKPVKYFGGEENLVEVKESDRIKNEFCENNNINLLRIPYTEFNNINDILKGIICQRNQPQKSS